ncbi:MAG: hypothetical protein Q9190_005351 [Brigantiaea leucoxantha]
MDDCSEPTETSPLLRHPSNVLPEPSAAPSGALVNGSGIDGNANGVSKSAGDEEHQKQDDEDRVNQYKGMPEVRARLKYIVPAIAVGIFLSAADQTLIVSSYGKIGSELKALNKTSWVSTASFLAQGPLCAIAFISVAIALKLPKQESSGWRNKLKRIDFLGALTLITAVFTLLLGLDRGSNVSWKTPITIASLCVSFPLFILFGVVEQRFAAEPFAPGRIIWDRSLVACYLCNFFSFGGWLSVIFYLPLFFQAVDGFNATQAGVRLLPGISSGVCGSLFAGLLMQRTGRYYWLTVVAYTALFIGVIPILLCTDFVVNSTYGISAGLVIAAFGNGIGVTSSLIGLISNAAPKDQAVATACSYLFRTLGSVLGLSLSATVVQQSLRNQLQERLNSGDDAAEIVKRVRESLDYMKSLDPEVRAVVSECYGTATRHGFMLMLGIVFFAMCSSCIVSPALFDQRWIDWLTIIRFYT